MSTGKDAPAEEVLIVRRRHGDGEEGHHGGVWKIAYADFMTAMMAFFLVMWLINASNTETRASVASYFNPIKLTDSVSRKKGLKEIDEKANAGEKAEREKPDAKGDPKKKSPDASAADRQGAASGAPDRSSSATKSQGGAGSFGDATEAGTAFRDPFNPFAHNQYLSKDRTQREAIEPKLPAFEGAGEASRTHRNRGQGADIADDQTGSEQVRRTAERVKRDAERAVQQLAMTGGPGVEVTIESEGVVLSLTDTSTFGMFAIGSADPNNDLVRLINAIAPDLVANNERVIVRGHTDGRPFRIEKGNNNWRLAMARAEAAYLMLVRAGIEEARFERIEAYADRKLKIPRDPEAAANRRIEIVLRRGTQ